MKDISPGRPDHGQPRRMMAPCFSGGCWLAVFFLFTFLTSSGQPPILSEVLPSNHTVNMDADLYAFSDWIELHNPYARKIDLNRYGLSRVRDITARWRFPYGTTLAPGGFLVVWADSTGMRGLALHTSFRLAREGGTVYLWEDNLIIDSLVYPAVMPDISFGRTGSGETFAFFPHPTPGAPNTGESVRWLLPSQAPKVSLEGGFYEGAVDIYLIGETTGSVIRYTLDGSEPDGSSPLYSGKLHLTSTTVLRAAAWEQGRVRSRVITRNYFIGEDIALPVISIAMDPEYFWDDSLGFYVEGTNGLTGWESGHGPSPKSNFNRDWKRPMNVTFFDEKHRYAFSADGQVKVYGGWTRSAVIKSLALYTYEPIDYKLFPERTETRYTSFILRNGGNNWARSRLNDAVLQSLAINQADVDLQANRPAVLFINGEFWGVMNIREKINPDYVRTHYGIDQDSIDYIESYRTLKAGDWDHFRKMELFLATHDLSDPAHYATFSTMVDVQEMLNYFMVGIYSGHGDWIYNNNNNLRLWRPRRENGRWRWLLYDCDGAFSRTTGLGIQAAREASDILDAVLHNAYARDYFVGTFTALLNYSFAPERALRMIDSLKHLYDHDMPRHIAKWRNTDEEGDPAWWKDPNSPRYIQGQDGYGGPCLEDVSQWEQYFSTMRTSAAQRAPALLRELQEMFGLGEARKVQLSVMPSEGGVITVNGITLESRVQHATWYDGHRLRLRAEARHGYRFVGWYKAEPAVDPLIAKGTTWLYLDDGSDQGTSWQDPGFDDSNWKSGQAQLGYGDGDEATVISYGPDGGNKYITTWFRKHFRVSAPLPAGYLRLEMLCDDAAIVYLNGREVLRYNLPTGTVTYRTTALSAVYGEAEQRYTAYYIPASLLHEGENILAVEVHQVSAVSSDLSFDLTLGKEKMDVGETPVSTLPQWTVTVSGDTTLVALFDTLHEENTLFLNEIMPRNHHYPTSSPTVFKDWIELYNSGQEAVSLASLYLSNDPGNPGMCPYRLVVPGDDELAPGGCLTLWADNSERPYGRHLNFRLRGQGGVIYLYRRQAGEMVLLDSLVYGPVPTDMALARDGDAPGTWRLTDFPTPGRSNRIGFRERVQGIRINEIHVEEDPRKNDWVELYNENDVAVDAGGLFLTTDLDRPTLYRLPPNRPWQTVIPPKGYLVINNLQIRQGKEILLPFDLDPRGGAVGLSCWEGDRSVYLDYQRYGVVTNTVTAGRYPDGEGSWQVLGTPTPGSTNMVTYRNNELQDKDWKIFPNPSDGLFHLLHETTSPSEKVIVRVFTLTGSIVLLEEKDLTSSFQLDLRPLGSGAYLLEVKGNRLYLRRKLMIR